MVEYSIIVVREATPERSLRGIQMSTEDRCAYIIANDYHIANDNRVVCPVAPVGGRGLADALPHAIDPHL